MKCYAVVDPRKSEAPPPLPLHSAQLELGRVKRPKGLFRVSSARSCAAAAGDAAGACSELRVRRGGREGGRVWLAGGQSTKESVFCKNLYVCVND